MDELVVISPLEWEGLGSALLAGAIIGLERQVMKKAVGIRTSALICVATYVFIAVSFSVSTDISDPSRIIGQLVTGVGFLGAGVIIARNGIVLGVTSAAVIWILASIGVVVGSGYYLSGIYLSILTIVILVGIDFLERRAKWLHKSVDEAINNRNQRRTVSQKGINKQNAVQGDVNSKK